MFKFNLRNKLLLLSLMPLITILVITMSISYYTGMKALDDNISVMRDNLISERKQQLKEVTQAAAGIIAYQQSLGDKGDVKAALRDIKFGKTGYFYIYNLQGVNIFHALKPELEGKHLLGLTDSKGRKIIVGLLDAAQNGDGNFSFFFQKPGSSEQAEKLGYAVILPGTEWMLGTGAYIDDIESAVNKYSEKAKISQHKKLILPLTISLLLIILTIITIFLITTKFLAPIKRMVDNLNDIAKGKGDLTKRLQVSGQDEIAHLGKSFNLFVDKLQHMIQEIETVTAEVNQAGSSVRFQTKEISNKLLNHNQETEQVVSAMTEMSSTANEVATNTNQVAIATHAVTEDVMHAQQCVDTSLSEISGLMAEINSAADSVNALNEQSQKINDVLSVIGEIAEQTNLLALNAAIEAARAGEQGRGFAVVADEVRNLASRTQKSTSEINEMLSELHRLVAIAVKAMDVSQEKSTLTVDSSRSISDSLGAVTTAITSINDMSTQIATSATEQSSVTEEINRNVHAIQEIVIDLTQHSQDAENISLDIENEGTKLNKLINQFQI